jgi:DNA-binding Lrp family transcriptional regulator
MPLYAIEQFEIYVQGYLVEADSEADALERFFRGEGTQDLTSIEYAGISNDCGLSLPECPDLASELLDRGVIKGNDTIVPSIRSIREVK